jgi:hypothetical protein
MEVELYWNGSAGQRYAPRALFLISFARLQANVNVILVVAYDTFLGASASGANLFEVMVWLGVFGGVSPLSSNGYPFTPIATVTVGGTTFDLAYGLNGSVKVYSFVARGGAATNFSADLVSRSRGVCWRR